jgi:kumamolisin
MRFARPTPALAPSRVAVLLLLALVVAVPAVPGSLTLGGAHPARAVGASPIVPGRFVVAPAFLPGPAVRTLGPVPASTDVEVAVGLTGANASLAASTLALVDTPGTPDYRSYLTASQVADRFGPSAGQYRSAVAEFRAAGLSVQTSPDRTMLLVSGPAPEVATAFSTTFVEYQTSGRTFFSHPTPATLPGSLPWAGAIGLGNVSPIRPASKPLPGAVTPSASCSGSGGNGFTPCQIQKGYNISGLIASGSNGTGETIAVVDAYDAAETQTQLESDLHSFETGTNTPAGTVDYLYPVPTKANLNSTFTGWGTEEALDLEWARAMAPAATTKMTFAPDATAGLYASVDWLVAHQAANVISLSWGENDVGTFNAFNTACSSGCNATTDGSMVLLHPVFVAAALEGITVLSATGDCGAAAGTSGDSTDYPASDQYVIGVGGTNLALTSGDAWSSETAWGGNASGASAPGCENQGGSGGGWSPYPRPYWQVEDGTLANASHRGVPDVAAVAGTPVEVYIDGFATGVGGTSAACPIWAGYVTDLDSYAGSDLGFLTPSLYQAAIGPNGSKAFHDITSGSNGYSAGVGWDPVTGLGSMNGGALAPLVARTRIAFPSIDLNLSASPRFGRAPLAVTFTDSASGGDRPYSFYDVSFGDYNSSITTNGTVRHTFPHNGTYSAWAIVYDTAGNASVSEPIEIVVGGHALSVTVNASLRRSTVGQAVNFTANVTGGTAPYTYNWSFGDGTFVHNGTNESELHAYGYTGGFCATVAVHDAASPQDGGGSNRLLELVGAATTGFCPNGSVLNVTFHPGPVAWDLPGDLNLTTHVSGGTAPYTVLYASGDSYTADCDCGIFRVAGNQTVTVFVSDSVDNEANATANVTLYPALTGSFAASVRAGPAPLAVSFSGTVSGGHEANTTLWAFGDGTTAPGPFANHTYATPGFYLAVAHANDSFGGNASEGFLIDVLASNATGPVVTVTISPAERVTVGTEATFSASASGGTGGAYTFNWSFAPVGFSAFGATVQETIPYEGCLLTGRCPLRVNLTVNAANGSTAEMIPMSLGAFEAGNASALVFTTSLNPESGGAPFPVFGTARATGVPGATVEWVFGDGGSASGLAVQHTYATDGNYTVIVTATDEASELLLETWAVWGVGPGPSVVVIAGGANASSGIAPLPITFHVAASGGTGPPYNYTWSFGDGQVGYGPEPNVTYLLAGSYQAFVTARDPRGAHGTLGIPVQAYNTTTVNLTATLAPNATTPGGRVALTVAANADCDAGAVPTCASANVTVRTFIEPVGTSGGSATPTPVTSPLSLAPSGAGAATFDAPNATGSYLVTVSTVGRNYTGFVVEYLVVNATAPPPSADLTVSLIVGSVVVGLGVGAIALVVDRRRPGRPRDSVASTEPPS